MACVWTDKYGNRVISFVAKDGTRPKVSIGRATLKDANDIARRIESLNTTAKLGTTIDGEMAAWLAKKIAPKLYDRLCKVGLTQKREIEPTVQAEKQIVLGKFIDDYSATLTKIKQSTRDHLKRARKDLADYFGENKPINQITPGDADEFRRWLGDRYPGDNTVRRICGRAKQFFRSAARKKLIVESPFVDMKDTCVRANREREFFVSCEMARKVSAACPDNQWRLIFALSRWGGLRCPSEHLAIRWGDIDWERNRMTVHSPKTAHHSGHESRVIPIFPELLPHLEEAFHAAADKSLYVITSRQNAKTNFRTQLCRIIEKAGLKPWPKLFQNLRSTRETELAESYPIHVVCAWIGNSEAVAKEHYLQVTDAHFSKAAGIPGHADGQYGVESVCRPLNPSSGNRKFPQKTQKLLNSVASLAPPVGLEPTTSRLTAGCSTN